MTGIGLASRQISEENSRLCGCDLMEISAHSGARPSHAVWQGQIVSLSGRRGYLSKSDIGYGTGAGFGGWNCRHDWYPFYEGISTRNYNQSDLDKLNAKDIEYNGKMYSEYEISQMLRDMERQSRALKRQKVALKTAIDEGQTFLKSDLTALNGKIRDKSAQIQSFCSETGYKRDRFREQVGGKTSVRHTSKNYANSLNILKLTDFESKKTFDGLSLNKQFQEEIFLIPKHLLDKVENHINNIFVRKGISGYSKKGRNIYLDTEPQKGDIIHEFAHAIEDLLNLKNSQKYQEILQKGLENYTNYDIMEEIKRYEKSFFYVDNNKFVTQYQGRLYIEHLLDDIDWGDDLNSSPEIMKEYFSEGFKFYILYPDILKDKDLELYNFIKEICENE